MVFRVFTGHVRIQNTIQSNDPAFFVVANSATFYDLYSNVLFATTKDTEYHLYAFIICLYSSFPGLTGNSGGGKLKSHPHEANCIRCSGQHNVAIGDVIYIFIYTEIYNVCTNMDHV